MSILQNTPKNITKSASTDNYSEVRDDLKSIKDESFDLARHLKDDVVQIAESVAVEGKHRYDDAKSHAEKYLKVLEKEVTEKPIQSVAIAMGVGAAIGLLLRRA